MSFLFWIIIFGALIVVIASLFSDEIQATRERDPAARSAWEVLLLYSGLHAIISHRFAHFLWEKVPVKQGYCLRVPSGVKSMPPKWSSTMTVCGANDMRFAFTFTA